jgi:predicted nucleic-acid-binding protein
MKVSTNKVGSQSVITNKVYWQVSTTDGGYKVSKEVKDFIVDALLENKMIFVEVQDIHDARVGIMLKYVTDWHESTPEARFKAVQFKKQIDKDAEID